MRKRLITRISCAVLLFALSVFMSAYIISDLHQQSDAGRQIESVQNPTSSEQANPLPTAKSLPVGKDQPKTKAQPESSTQKKDGKTETQPAEARRTLSSRGAALPPIHGSDPFSQKVNKALELLHTKAPYYANKVTTYLSRIEESDHSGVKVETGVFYLGQATVNSQDEIWLASVLVHDAYHVELYKKGQNYYGKAGETQCINQQKKVLQQLAAPAYYLTYLDQTLASDYWDVPFEQRNW